MKKEKEIKRALKDWDDGFTYKQIREKYEWCNETIVKHLGRKYNYRTTKTHCYKCNSELHWDGSCDCEHWLYKNNT